MDGNELRKYLEGSAEDYQSLADHDRIYHKGGYKEGDACKVRETLQKSDDPDRMQKKAEGFAGRTQSRKDVAGVLEKLFGAGATFDENDSGDDNAVSFRVESKRILPFGEKQYERKLEDAGYKARLEYSGGFDPHQVRGCIRRFTPQENLERIKAQKPKYNPDGDYKVDGEYYDDQEEAMTAWKSAMKKYGSASKKYLSMCNTEDWGIFDRSAAAKKGWQTRKAGGGWNPNVGMKESGSHQPKWNNPSPVVANPAKRESEMEKIASARKEYDKTGSAESKSRLFDATSHIWDEGKRDYFS